MWRRIDVFREDSNVFPWGNRSVSPKYTVVSPQDTCVFPQDINIIITSMPQDTCVFPQDIDVSSHKTSKSIMALMPKDTGVFAQDTGVFAQDTCVSPQDTGVSFLVPSSEDT